MKITHKILIEQLTTLIYAVVLAFTFCGLFLFPQGHSILSNLVVIASICGLTNAYIYRNNNFGLKDYRLPFIFAIYATEILLNRLYHGDEYGIMRNLFYVATFAWLIPRKCILLRVTCIAIVVGGIGIGALAIYQYLHGIPRPEGFTNANLFAMASLIMTLMSWFVLKESHEHRLIRYTAFFSLAGSLSALVLSQSRGVWLALISVIFIAFFFRAIRSKQPIKYIAWFISCIALVFIIYQNTPLIQNRLGQGSSDLQLVEQGNFNTSWGLRVLAWKSAWLGFKSSPWVGVGGDGFGPLKKEQVAKKIIPPSLLNQALYHAHNQYLQNMVIRGGVGLSALCILLFAPINIMRKKYWFSTGMLIPLSFAICGLSDVPFEHQNTLYMYSICLVFIWLFFSLKEDSIL